jgi:hypothetical protein
MRRFKVVEESMLPVLRPGDLLVAWPDADPAAGSIVVFPHPGQSGMWLVKRVAAAEAGEAWVLSDNAGATRADSRTFGWVSTELMHRARWRFRRPLSITRLTADA